MENYKLLFFLAVFTMSVAMESNAMDGDGKDANSESSAWSLGGGYSRISMEDGKFGALYASLGYRWKFTDELRLVPVVTLAQGVQDDDYMGATIEFQNYFTVSVRLQTDLEGFYLYAQPLYGRGKVSGSFEYEGLKISVSDSDSGWGIGAGVGVELNSTLSLEATYNHMNTMDGVNFMSVGMRYWF